MKQLFILLIFTVAYGWANAQGVSHCTIYSSDQYKFTVYLNGEKKNDVPDDNVRIVNLTQRYYKLKVEFQDTSLAPIEKKIFNLQDANGNPVDATFEINRSRKGELNVYWRSQSVHPPYIDEEPTVVVVPSATAVQQTTTTTTTTSSPDASGINVSTPFGSVRVNTGETNDASSTQETTTTTVYTSSAPAATGTGCAGTVMGDSDFKSALSAVAGRSAEESKLLMAKQIMSGSCMASTQVKQMLQQLSTEQARLELAIFAYDRTVDKGNYYKVNDVFQNEASVDELNKAILK